MHPIQGGTCVICGERLLSPYVISSQEGEPQCGVCRRVPPPYARAVAYGGYDGGLRELIHQLKYEQIRPAADFLGEMLMKAVGNLEPAFGKAPILVIPVPLHPKRLRQRGYNQTELIVQAALKLAAKRKSGNVRLQLKADALRRVRPTESQTGLTRHQRRENMRGAFAVSRPSEIKGREILLVDDVFTTGTTVSECARILRKSGASKVWVATVARTLKLEVGGMELAIEPEFAKVANG